MGLMGDRFKEALKNAGDTASLDPEIKNAISGKRTIQNSKNERLAKEVAATKAVQKRQGLNASNSKHSTQYTPRTKTPLTSNKNVAHRRYVNRDRTKDGFKILEEKQSSTGFTVRRAVSKQKRQSVSRSKVKANKGFSAPKKTTFHNSFSLAPTKANKIKAQNTSTPEYKEENTFLKRFVGFITSKAEQAFIKMDKLRNEILDDVSVDYPGINARADNIQAFRKLKDQLGPIVDQRNNPYFAHVFYKMDDGMYKDFFIGKEPLTEKGKTEIISWNSDLGRQYNNKRQYEFDLNGHNYKLQESRGVLIHLARLISVNVEFSIKDDEEKRLEKLAKSNKFLRALLLDKRRDRKLTDIIPSIQQNQYAIMDQPKQSNFIVQGCAGSGKTMVLLHRISLNLFNAEKEAKEYVVITPNENFNLYIDELSMVLDLNDVTKYSIQEFYYYLITRMAAHDSTTRRIDGHNRDVAKISISKQPVVSESLLNAGYLTEIYSVKFQDSFIKEYNAIWNDAFAKFKEIGLFDVFKKFKQKKPNSKKHEYSTYASLIRSLGVIVKNSLRYEAMSSYETVLSDLEKLERKNEDSITDADLINLDKLSQKKASLEKDLSDLENIDDKLNEDEVKVILRAEKIIKSLDVRFFNRKLHNMRLAVCRKNNCHVDIDINYLHLIYLKLLLCAYYYRQCTTPFKYINIDEAQDISVAEYKVLSMLFDEDVVYNFYGDVHQRLSSSRGIDDWKQLESVKHFDLYKLNENFRNTQEIIEYCNKSFDMDCENFGVTINQEVKLISYPNAIKELTALKQKEFNLRIAIIYKRGLQGIKSSLEGLFNENVSWGQVEDGKISVITVEEAKGLEFDAVLVLANEMSVNERYVAYTRALDYLYIDKLKNVTIGEVDELEAMLEEQYEDFDVEE